MPRPERAGCLVNDPPNLVGQLNVLDILRQVIDPIEQRKWVAQRREGRPSQTGSYSKPGLFSDLNGNAIFDRLKSNAQGGLSTRRGTLPAGNLNVDLRAVADLLYA